MKKTLSNFQRENSRETIITFLSLLSEGFPKCRSQYSEDIILHYISTIKFMKTEDRKHIIKGNILFSKKT